jgi:5-methylcytosine-specific restriction endonuclease McrA
MKPATFLYPRAKARLKEFLHKRQGGECCYCGRMTRLYPEPWGLGAPAPADFATLEHLRRKVDGGTNHPDNVAIACFECNSNRGAMSWVEFKTFVTRGLAA